MAQPPLERLQTRLVYTFALGRLELFARLLQQTMVQAPLSKFQMRLRILTGEPTALRLVGLIERAAVKVHATARQPQLTSTRQGNEVLIAELTDVTFEHLAIAQHEKAGLGYGRRCGGLRECRATQEAEQQKCARTGGTDGQCGAEGTAMRPNGQE